MSSRSLDDLKYFQAMPLNIKVAMTKTRIREWVNHYGVDGVYCSFSAGKDSTVLLNIARQEYPEMKAMFVDVPTQYPELREFAKTFDNVDVVKPRISFMQVCEKYGFPIFSKEICENVNGAKQYWKKISKEMNLNPNILLLTDNQRAELASVLNYRMKNDLGGSNQRLAIMLGMFTRNKENPISAEGDGGKSKFDFRHFLFMFNAPFEISNKCCNVMKKEPAHNYNKETGRHPITAQMTEDSRVRLYAWFRNGCNAFDLAEPISNPMSFWTEQDVLQYIKQNNLPMCSVYGDIVEDRIESEEVEGQLTFSDLGYDSAFDAKPLPLKTTGCDRTGCMLCGFGCHVTKSPNRFEQIKETHPKMYDLLDVVKNNGVTMKEALDWINDNSKLNIRY